MNDGGRGRFWNTVATAVAVIAATLPGRVAAQVFAPVLRAHTWQLISSNDASSAAIPALQPRPGMPVVVEFVDDRIVVHGGCNLLTGRYRFDGERKLVVDRIVGTNMACEQALMDIDSALVALFASPLRIDVAVGAVPRLHLATTRTTLEFAGRATPEALFGPSTIAFLEVAPDRGSCAQPDLVSTTCLQVRDVRFDAKGLRVGAPGEWRPLFGGIDGFEHVDGVGTILRVERFIRTPASSDTTAIFYVLDMVVESGAHGER